MCVLEDLWWWCVVVAAGGSVQRGRIHHPSLDTFRHLLAQSLRLSVRRKILVCRGVDGRGGRICPRAKKYLHDKIGDGQIHHCIVLSSPRQYRMYDAGVRNILTVSGYSIEPPGATRQKPLPSSSSSRFLPNVWHI
jgi:hypothetical protein